MRKSFSLNHQMLRICFLVLSLSFIFLEMAGQTIPVINSFSPTSGQAGTVVIIIGNNFSITPANNRVNFNGVEAVVNSATSGSLNVSVPIGARSGLITVTVNGQIGISTGSFNVICNFELVIEKISDNLKCVASAPNTGSLQCKIFVSGTEINDFSNYTFQWFKGTNTDYPISSPEGNQYLLHSLDTGSYSVVATSSAGCSSVILTARIVLLIRIPSMTVDVLSQQTKCYPPDGELEAKITEETGWNFTWLNTSGAFLSEGSKLSGALAGNYIVIATKDGCTVPANAVIQDFAIYPEVQVNLLSNIGDCVSLNSGSISASVYSLGVVQNSTDYTFNWYNYDNKTDSKQSLVPAIHGTGSLLTGLPAGFYKLEVVNNSTQCQSLSGGIIEIANVQILPEIVITEDHPQTSCDVFQPNGVLRAEAFIGGLKQDAASFHFEWFIGETQEASNLLPQTGRPESVSGTNGQILNNVFGNGVVYSVRVTSTTNCHSIARYSVSDSNQLQISLYSTPITTCASPDGNVVVNVDNAEPGETFNYAWYKGEFKDLLSLGSLISSSNSLNGLGNDNVANGAYTVAVKSNLTGCSNIISGQVKGFPEFSINSVNSTSCQPENGTILVENINTRQDETFSYVWYKGIGINSANKIGEDYGGSSSELKNIGPLLSLNYTVNVISNLTSCSKFHSITLQNNSSDLALPYLEFSGKSAYNCDPELPNGSAFVTANGSSSNDDYDFQWYSNLNLSGSIISNTNELVNVAAGDYSVRVTQKSTGCFTEGIYVVPFKTYTPFFKQNGQATPSSNCSELQLADGFVNLGLTDFYLNEFLVFDPEQDFTFKVYNAQDNNNLGPMLKTGTFKGSTVTINNLGGTGSNYVVNIKGNTSGCETWMTFNIPDLSVKALSASNVTDNSFVASWKTLSDSASYLEVSTDPLFKSSLSNYSGLKFESDTYIKYYKDGVYSARITGLEKGTNYYYRVRNSRYEACNSIAQITAPSMPNPNPITNSSDNFFIASWPAVKGADGYEVDVSRISDNFKTLTPGYSTELITFNGSNGDVKYKITNVMSGTLYLIRVRAVNKGGKSDNSNAIISNTTGSPKLMQISLNSKDYLFLGERMDVKGFVSNAIGGFNSEFSYKGITETKYKTLKLTSADDSVRVSLDESMFDDLGLEFTVSAVDQTNQFVRTQVQRIYRYYDGNTSPLFVDDEFNGTSSSMKIISIPYELKDAQISSIFSSLGNLSYKKSWRIAHYDTDLEQNIEYLDKLIKVKRGLGYWFNARKQVSVFSGEGSVGQNYTGNPFKLTLKKGWNQIGNPYPFSIDWEDIRSDNSAKAGDVSSLYIYDGSQKNYRDGNTLNPYEGGFVEAKSDMTLDVKVALKATSGGRVGDSDDFKIQGSWILPMHIEQGNIQSTISNLGMHPEASISSNDRFDVENLPRLEEYLELLFESGDGSKSKLVRNIVNAKPDHVWDFSIVSSRIGESTQISWYPDKVNYVAGSFYLLDLKSGNLTNMKYVNSYRFVNGVGDKFKIYYNTNGDFNPDILMWGTPYPNPGSNHVNFNFIVPDVKKENTIELIIYDLMGRRVNSVIETGIDNGAHAITWNCDNYAGDKVNSGLYVVKARVNAKEVSGFYKVEIN